MVFVIVPDFGPARHAPEEGRKWGAVPGNHLQTGGIALEEPLDQ
jgi:hypothetical protein